MKTSQESLLHLLAEYQNAHKIERLELLRHPEIRRELSQSLQHYEQTGRARRLSQQKLQQLAEIIRDPSIEPPSFFSTLDDFRFPLEFWNRLRQIVEVQPTAQTPTWQSAQIRACLLRNEIIERTAYLVSKYRRLNFYIEEQRIDDADGNGFLGLLKAIDNFSYTEGRSFEGYARIYIINQIICFLRNDRLVKPSDALRRFYNRHDSIVEELTQHLRREPTPQEIASALDIEVDELSWKQEQRGALSSLDSEIGTEEDLTLHDLIGEEAALPYERMENHLMADRLLSAMGGLTHTETVVVSLRWTPLHESELRGPIHPAPVALEKMRSWSFLKISRALALEQNAPD